MQNLARFQTTLKFGCEYLRNEWRYLKSDNHSVYGDFFCVGETSTVKFGYRFFKIWEGKKRPKFSTFYDNFGV